MIAIGSFDVRRGHLRRNAPVDDDHRRDHAEHGDVEFVAAERLHDGRPVGEFATLDRRVHVVEVPLGLHHVVLQVGEDRHVRERQFVRPAQVDTASETDSRRRAGTREVRTSREPLRVTRHVFVLRKGI